MLNFFIGNVEIVSNMKKDVFEYEEDSISSSMLKERTKLEKKDFFWKYLKEQFEEKKGVCMNMLIMKRNFKLYF